MKNHAFLQTELLYAPEGPAGASAEQYRSHAYAVPSMALTSAVLMVELLDDPDRARFIVECVVEPGSVEAGVEFASEAWAYDIPALEGEILGLRAWDGAGGLQTDLLPGEGRATRLRVRFRRLVRHGEPYRFWYEYQAPVRGVVCTGILTRTVACAGWLIFNLPCDSIQVSIRLPRGARLVKSAPAGDVTEPGAGAPCIRYPLQHLRALEAYHWLVAYERRRIGLTLYLWAASQFAAAFAGWVIGRALDGWTGPP